MEKVRAAYMCGLFPFAAAVHRREQCAVCTGGAKKQHEQKTQTCTPIAHTPSMTSARCVDRATRRQQKHWSTDKMCSCKPLPATRARTLLLRGSFCNRRRATSSVLWLPYLRSIEMPISLPFLLQVYACACLCKGLLAPSLSLVHDFFVTTTRSARFLAPCARCRSSP